MDNQEEEKREMKSLTKHDARKLILGIVISLLLFFLIGQLFVRIIGNIFKDDIVGYLANLFIYVIFFNILISYLISKYWVKVKFSFWIFFLANLAFSMTGFPYQ